MCSSEELILVSVYTIIALVLSFTTIWALIHFVSFMKEQTKIEQISVIIFFIFSLCAILSLICVSAECFMPSEIYEISEQVFVGCWAVQSYLLVLILFNKLRDVFKGSIYELSALLRLIYTILFVVYPSAMVYMYILYFEQHSLTELVVGFGSIAFMFSIAILFVSKLIMVFRAHKKNCGGSADNGTIINAITKISILLLFIIFATALHTIAGLTFHVINDTIYHYTEILNAYIDFFCVMLCFKSFVSYYTNICSRTHSLCHICCTCVASGNCHITKRRISVPRASATATKIIINGTSQPNTPQPNTPQPNTPQFNTPGTSQPNTPHFDTPQTEISIVVVYKKDIDIVSKEIEDKQIADKEVDDAIKDPELLDAFEFMK